MHRRVIHHIASIVGGRVLIGEGLKGLFSGVLVLTGWYPGQQALPGNAGSQAPAPSSFPKPSKRLGCALRVLNSVLQPAKCS